MINANATHSEALPSLAQPGRALPSSAEPTQAYRESTMYLAEARRNYQLVPCRHGGDQGTASAPNRSQQLRADDRATAASCPHSLPAPANRCRALPTAAQLLSTAAASAGRRRPLQSATYRCQPRQIDANRCPPLPTTAKRPSLPTPVNHCELLPTATDVARHCQSLPSRCVRRRAVTSY